MDNRTVAMEGEKTDKEGDGKNASKTRLPKIKNGRQKSVADDSKLQGVQQEYINRLEEQEGRPDLVGLYQGVPKKSRKDRCCICDACNKRRTWLALQYAGVDETGTSIRQTLQHFVCCAFRGETKMVDSILKQHGDVALRFVGGPVAVTNCEVCLAKYSHEKCHHCGKEPWMRGKTDLKTARRDLRKIPRYLTMTALHAACLGGQVEVAKQLIKAGADLQATDDLGCIPLHWITCNGHKPVTFQSKVLAIWELLLRFDVDITQLDSSGKAAIELTAPPNPPILKAKKKVLNEQLIEYCQEGNSDMVFRSIRAGADLGAGDWLNDTPLYTAVTFGHEELAFSILKAAEEEKRSFQILTARTVDGLTPYDAAVKWRYPAVAKRLKAMENAARLRELTEQIIKGGGWEVPQDLKGTLLGKQLENELKQRAHAAKAARLTIVAEKKEALRLNRLQEQKKKQVEKEAVEDAKRRDKEASLQKQAKEQEKAMKRGLAAAMDAATGKLTPAESKSKACIVA